VLILAAVGLAACVPVGSALAIFTSQATVTANTVGTAASFPVCYANAVLADTPVGYWRLDETSGTSAVDSKGGRNGTYTNGPTLGQTGALPDALNNRSTSFDGTDDYVNVPYAAALNPAQFTVEGWGKVTGGSGTWRLLASSWSYPSPSDHRGYWIGVDDQDRWTVHVGNGSITEVSVDGPTVTLNSWTHLAATYDGTTLAFYVNGTRVGTLATTTYAVNASPVAFEIGAEYFNGARTSFFIGSIDEVALYNTALSAAQIRTHYNSGRCYKDGVLADSPTGYWRLGESSGATAADGIRGRHGTYVGSPTLAATGALNGDSNTAITLNGASQYVSVPYDSALNPSQVTVEAWAKPTGGAGTARTVVASQDTNKGYLLGIGTDNKWRFTVGTGAATTVVTGSTVTLNSWAHVVGTYDGSTATLYVDGVSAGTASGTVSVNTTRPLGIGATDAGGSWAGYFPGSLDEVALYTSALSQTRVQAHYLLGRSYQDTVLDAGPVSFWRLGESSGTSAADSKGSNTGTYTNGPALALAGALAGDADTAAGFDGTNDYVNVPYAAALNPAQFTVEAWVDPTSGSGNWYEVASSWSNSGSRWIGYALEINPSNNWIVYVGDGSHVEPSAVGPVRVLNAWTHLAVTYDGSTLRLYVNGTQAASTATTFYAGNSSPVAFEIGAEYANGTQGAFFPGVIDDVAVYNRALTATEVQLHYDSGRQ
jgi:hypothetical protein